MQEFSLSEKFSGLNRQLAPHLLGPNESPDTVDAGPHLDVIGELGPRTGRRKVYNRSAVINGVINMKVPGENFRIVCTADGVWHPENLTFPSLTDTVNGYDRVFIDTLSAFVSGVGVSNGTAKVLSESLELSGYTRFDIMMGSYYGFQLTPGNPGNSCVATLQFKIGGVWTDVCQATWDGATFGIQQLISTGTGTFDQVRAKMENLSHVAGNDQVDINLYAFLYGATTQRKDLTVA